MKGTNALRKAVVNKGKTKDPASKPRPAKIFAVGNTSAITDTGSINPQPVGVYSNSQKILVLNDSNLSFALSLSSAFVSRKLFFIIIENAI